MTRNVYDDPGFFAGYSRLPRSVHGLDGAPEWPALRAMLPPLHGKHVLDLGCGFGWFCLWARDQGAARVLGFDVSENMLARARAETAISGIEYARADLEDLELPRETFDLIYSSLVFHYIEDLAGLFGRIRDALVPGGRFVFSVEHPIYTAPTNPGWLVDAAGHKTWPIDSYGIEGPRRTNWLAEGVIKQHRMLATYLTLLIGVGLTVSHVEEWRPDASQTSLAEELHRPMFLLVAAGRGK